MSNYYYDRRGVLCDRKGAVMGKNIKKALKEIKKKEGKDVK